MNRIAYKIFFTACNFLLTTTVFIFVARSIGVENYGNLSYLLATYVFLLQTLMIMSSTAYIFFLSSKNYDNAILNTFMVIFYFCISLIILIITLITSNLELGIKYLWGNISEPHLLYSCFFLVFFINLQNILLNYSDSTLQTIKSENTKFISKLALFIFIFSLFSLELLTLETYIISAIFSLILFFFIFNRVIEFRFSKILKNKLIEILREFISYLKPLLLMSFLAVFYIYYGKYILQISSGPIEQGYYGVAFQLAMLPVAIITPIMPIIMREITEKI